MTDPVNGTGATPSQRAQSGPRGTTENADADGSPYPVLVHTAIDARDPRRLAEFYREFLGLHYRDRDRPPTDGSRDTADWIVLLDGSGRRVVTIQRKGDTVPPTWPSESVPMQMHMDFAVPDVVELERHCERATALGARVLHDRTDVVDAPLYVLADPAGHPFCLLV